MSFLVEYPEAFEFLPAAWRFAFWQMSCPGTNVNWAPGEFCPICAAGNRQARHECPGATGCPCCEGSTPWAGGSSSAPHQSGFGVPDHLLTEPDEDEDEEEDPNAAEREAGEYWDCAACGNELFSDTENETWALLTEASATIATAKIGRGDAGQAMCEQCLSEAGLDLEEAVQDELEDYCSDCGELEDECECNE